MGYVLATKQLINEKMKVGFMYRESPDNESDSGWRFFVGNESVEYVNNPDNVGIYDIDTIINLDKDVVPLLSAPCGSSFERNDDGHFVATEKSK